MKVSYVCLDDLLKRGLDREDCQISSEMKRGNSLEAASSKLDKPIEELYKDPEFVTLSPHQLRHKVNVHLRETKWKAHKRCMKSLEQRIDPAV